MELTLWMPWYERIVAAFGYSTEKDRDATIVLRELLTGVASPLARLRGSVMGRDVVVLGAGPSLESNLESLTSMGLEKFFVLMAADGATTALLERSIVPHMIVSDLDGCMDDIISASKRGSTVVVHAHGDNIDAMREWIPRIIANKKGELYGTTQVEPFPPLIHNFGGFTDGDRCVFLAEEMKAKTIILAGMDFGMTIGKYSKATPNKASSLQNDEKWLSNKRFKLQFAKELLEWLATWSRADGGLLNATGPRGQMIRGVPRVEFRVLQQIAKFTRTNID